MHAPTPPAPSLPAAGPRAPSLRGRLALLALLCLLPALALTLWHLQRLRSQALNDNYEKAEHLATAVEGALLWQAQEAREILERAARRPGVLAHDPARCDPIFGAPPELGYAALTLRGADGSVLCSAPAVPAPVAAVLAADWFGSAVDGSGFHTGGAFRAGDGAGWVAQFSLPVVGADGRRALLSMPLDLALMHQRLAAHYPPEAIVVVADAAGRVLVHSRLGAERFGQPAGPSMSHAIALLGEAQLARRLPAGGYVRFSRADRVGERRQYAARRMQVTGWYVMAAVQEDEALQGPRSALVYDAIAGVLLLLGTLLLAAHFARRIARPLEQLSAAVSAYEPGKPGPPVAAGGAAEIQALADAFNRAQASNAAAWSALQRQKERNERLLRSMPVGVTAFGANGEVLFRNERARVLRRLDEAEALADRRPGAEASCLVDASGRRLAPAEYPVSRTLADGRPVEGEVIGFVAAGDGAARPYAWAMVHTYPLRAADGQIESVIAVAVDITAQREAEQLRVERDAARAANQAKTEFLSQMSHELRTPLNSILGFAQLLEIAPELAANSREKLGYIKGSGEHLLALINDALEIGRVESGRLVLAPTAVELAPLVDECLRDLHAAAAEQAVEIGWEGAAPPALCAEVDRVRLKQIVLNLLSNAVKYNRPGGRVAVAVGAATLDDGAAAFRIDVQDSGHGIAAEHLPALFQPFNRLDAVRRGIPGTGIGLSVSRLLARAMGGDITVHSTPQVGSRFSVTLPLAPLAGSAAAGAAAGSSLSG